MQTISKSYYLYNTEYSTVNTWKFTRVGYLEIPGLFF
jgi:hypothetical protein